LGSHPLQVWTGTWASFFILSVISFTIPFYH
jgi:cytochrome c oxidase subunit IV